MLRKSSLLATLGTLSLGFISTVRTTENYIVSGDPWRDTSGTYNNAHGAGLLHDPTDSLWYWVGERKNSGNGFQGVSLYSSSDLINWDSHGLIVPPSTTLPFQVGERPKLIRNPKTGDPLGMESRYMNVYIDTYNNNQGYLLFATNGNADVGVAKMTSDYKNVTTLVSTIHSRLEGFGVFRDNTSLYNMVVSNQSGWQPNPNSLYISPNLAITGLTYSNYVAPNAYNTYNSQNTFEISPNDNLEVYLGDRWWVTDLEQSSYVWYSLQSLSLFHTPLWKPDPSTPNGYSIPSNKSFPLSPSTTTITGNSQAKISPCSICPSGQIATYIGNGNTFTLNSVSTPNGKGGLVWISVYYSNQNAYPDRRFRSVMVNNGSLQNVTFPTGGSPNSVLQDTPVKVNLNPGSRNTITFGARESNPTSYAADISHIFVWQSDQ